MNIFLFIDSLGAGGAQRQLCGLACLLKEKGYNVKVVSYYNHPFYLYLLEENGIAYECLNRKSFFCFNGLLRSIKAFEADVVIAYQTVPGFIATLCSYFGKYNLIVSERNTNITTTWKDRLFFNIFRKADYIVPNSYSQGEYIRKTFPFLSNKINVISNFVDLKKFVPNYDKKPKVFRKLLIVASIKDSKNTKVFIEAFRIAKSKGCKMIVKWYGINPKEKEVPENYTYTQECLLMVKKYRLEKQLQLLPKVKEIDKEYKKADIFCLPSLFEGTPNVICEAMASGLPIICSDVCDNHIFVKNGENGFLFDPKNPDDIADKILKIENCSDTKLKKMSQKSRMIAENLCSPNKFVEKYIQLIEK